ncbi:MAG: HPr family phosphocarrier protein [Oscillospiraceae bacterium]|nr:HPr family phosphocarrier protein [Oscillospiraceae bacterium]
MRMVNISLPTAEAVQDFVAQISQLGGQFDLLSGKYVLDAKSLMGIFSLDLTKPLTLRIEKDTAGTMQAIERFIA